MIPWPPQSHAEVASGAICIPEMCGLYHAGLRMLFVVQKLALRLLYLFRPFKHYVFLNMAIFYRLWRSLFVQLTALSFVFNCFSYIHMKYFGSSRVHRVQRLVLEKNICILLVFKRKVNKIEQDEKSWGEMLAPP